MTTLATLVDLLGALADRLYRPTDRRARSRTCLSQLDRRRLDAWIDDHEVRP